MPVQYDQPSGGVVYDQSPQSASDPEGWKRALGLTGRAIATGVSALPAAAMDLGVGARNMLTGEHYEMPSSMLQQSLTGMGLPEPQTKLEKAGSFIERGLSGGAIPIGKLTAGAQAPANFMSPDETKRQLLASALQRYQGQGLSVPPSTTNPTLLNRALETVAGKENTQNFARIGNDAARTKIAAKALGLNEDAPLTEGAVQSVLKEAGQSFEKAKSVPRFNADPQYGHDLDKVVAEGQGANADFPGASRPDIEQLVNTYRQSSMSGQSVVPAVKMLRDRASTAFSSGDSELGRAYKGISQALENQMDRAVQDPALGASSDAVQSWRAGRQLYAKASLVRDSMLPDGTISGQKLASAWRRDEPITGPLRDAAEFAAQFPKANIGASASGSPVSHLGGMGALISGGAAEALTHAMGHESGVLPLLAGGIAYPAARQGARAYLLSQMGQRGAIPAVAKVGGITPQQLSAALAAFSAPASP